MDMIGTWMVPEIVVCNKLMIGTEIVAETVVSNEQMMEAYAPCNSGL
jgi:hypothetical protein